MSDYSLSSYTRILRTALSRGYRFAPFGSKIDVRRPTVFLRHDLDYSLGMGVDVGRVNASLGIRGTFFILLRSELYNPLSPTSLARLATLHALKQNLGLHVEVRREWGLAAGLHQGVARDFATLKAGAPAVSPVCSWHNPTPLLLKRFRNVRRIGGLLNTYALEGSERVTYLSDSNQRHRVDDFLHALDPHKQPLLQFLFHPLYWVCGGTRLEQAFAKTWTCVVREREAGFQQNANYQRWFPKGMPEAVLRRFAARWMAAIPKSRK